MGRKLPEFDPETDGDYATSKRRLQIFKRIYQHLQHWYCLMETGDMDDILLTADGEEVYYYDLLIGMDSLPERQRQAFDLICLQGYTESAATAIMLPNSRWSTPIQQYSDMALARMVKAYDEKQAGTWDPKAMKKRGKKSDLPSSPAKGNSACPETTSSPALTGNLKKPRTNSSAKTAKE